ncbi:MAG: hypothetical protein H0W86_06215, partial [Armatimonadetes bacterium]|nr:hypothetical protein [Armatimonadota bacterium]
MKQFAAVMTFAAAATLSAQSFYNGQPIATTGVTLSSWGGGKIIESKESSLAGGNALRVETGNLFQGGLISTASPLSLSGAAGNK